MFAMPAVNVPLDDVIDMPLVRNRHVFAADAVLVFAVVRIAGVARIARLHVARAEFVFVDVIAMGVMQMSVVRVVDVIVVQHG